MSDRAAYWRRLLGEWERSGLSQAEFCRRRRLKAVTFAWWKRRLAQPGEGNRNRRRRDKLERDRDRPARRLRSAEPVGFVEVARPRGPASASWLHPPALLPARDGYELVLPGGAHLRLPDDFDPERVARLMRAVAATC